MGECQCDKCGRPIDPDEAHRMDYGFGPWPKYGYTCKDCMEITGEKCAKCGEYFYLGEGIEVSILAQEFEETEQESESRELYGGKFLCHPCFDEAFPGRPVKDDLQENE